MRTKFRTFSCLVALLAVGVISAQQSSKKGSKTTTPAVGSKLRKEILDSLRPKIESALGVKVRYKVDRLSVLNGWAFLAGVLLDSKDRPIDLRKTRLKEDAEYMDGPSIYGLAKIDPKSKKWVHVTHVVGPTDVAWSDWHVRFKCPKEILGIPALLD
jgi:hypothetical protein